MRVFGVAAEYNPFHSGHAFHLARTREALGGAAAVAVMSGNWTQQAEPAIADKQTRAGLALLGGADLVLELPTVWACSSAESFARGAVSILAATGVVDTLSFGSECGDVDALRETAACLDSAAYRDALRDLLGQGLTFAACRQRAAGSLIGEKARLLAAPNNNLGVEYIRALNALGCGIEPVTVRREGAAHNAMAFLRRDGLSEQESRRLFWETYPFLSATELRWRLLEGEWELAEPYLPGGTAETLRKNLISPAGLDRVRWAILAKLRTMTAADWAALPDSGAAEGLPMRLERAARGCASPEGFFELAKTKRYTRSRLERLALWAWLGLSAADVPPAPPYLRVLGANGRGREVLRRMKKTAALPIVTKPAHVRALDGTARRLFELEARCTDLYGLCRDQVPPCGAEWTRGPVIV